MKKVLLSLLVSVTMSLNAQDVFYRNTEINCSGLNIKLEQCVGVKDNIKFKAILNNLTDQYIVIDPKDILVSTPQQSNKRVSRRRPIMLAPKDVVRLNLRSPAIKEMKEAPINVNFARIIFSGTPLNSFKAEVTKLKTASAAELEKLDLKVLKEELVETTYIMNLLVTYDRTNFLVIDHHKAFCETPKGKFYNTRKKSAVCFDNEGESQILQLVFPCGKNSEVEPRSSINLNEVFKEYTLDIKTGYQTELKIISKEDFLLQKKEIEEVIEEVE